MDRTLVTTTCILCHSITAQTWICKDKFHNKSRAQIFLEMFIIMQFSCKLSSLLYCKLLSSFIKLQVIVIHLDINFKAFYETQNFYMFTEQNWAQCSQHSYSYTVFPWDPPLYCPPIYIFFSWMVFPLGFLLNMFSILATQVPLLSFLILGDQYKIISKQHIMWEYK